MMPEGSPGSSAPSESPLRALTSAAGIAAAYFVLAKAGLALASINPSATPIWPPSGFALAAMLLWGYRFWPAIYLAAFLANVTNAGTFATSAAIATGNTLECVVGAFLIKSLAGGLHAFDTPARAAKFAAINLAPATISATIGVGALALAGFAEWPNVSSIWLTWWIGDVAGALVVAPVIILWVLAAPRQFSRRDRAAIGAIYLATCLVGLIAFSPLIELPASRGPLGFLAVVPLIAAALRGNPRDTATVAMILCGFAVWGTLAGTGPFALTTLNESFLMLLMFMISATVPSLVLSADASSRRRTELELRQAQQVLDQRVRERTEELAATNTALQSEVEQRMRVEANLRLQSAHLVEAQRLANLGSWVWDIANGRVTWSERLYEIYGVKPDEFGGTFDDFLARLHPDDRERVQAQITKAFERGEGFRLDERIVRPNGEIRHLHSSGEVVKDNTGAPVQMLGVCQDVTDRKVSDSARRQSEEIYRLTVEGIRDYAIYMIDREGRVVSWNAGAARIKGYTREEIVGEHFSRFYGEGDRKAGVPAQALAIAERTGKFEAEGWRVRKDGTQFWASIIIDAIRDSNGELIGFAKITRDITERRETQAALEQAREQLAQSQKMEALGQLTGGIAHDFNNLLMIVSGHAQLLQRRLTDRALLPAIEAIQSAANRGEALTRQLLGFSRRTVLSPVVVNPRERIDAIRDMLGSSLRGNIDLRFQIEDGLWPVKVDISELDLALVNIAVNARDAMPDGGTITLSARNVDLKPNQVAGDLRGEFVEIALADTGMGIAPEVLTKIFEPFFTTKAVGKGTGLGLSQVHGFAHQSGGTVTASSVLGQGTTVALYLPRSGDPAATAEVPSESRSPVKSDGLVLSVEDNFEVAEVTATMIEQFGYRVMRAENAAEALDCLKRSGRIDIVFSDIVMPGPMDGLALAQEIKKHYPGLPVVLATGYSESALAAEADFPLLRKPFQAAALERVLRDALTKSRSARA